MMVDALFGCCLLLRKKKNARRRLFFFFSLQNICAIPPPFPPCPAVVCLYPRRESRGNAFLFANARCRRREATRSSLKMTCTFFFLREIDLSLVRGGAPSAAAAAAADKNSQSLFFAHHSPSFPPLPTQKQDRHRAHRLGELHLYARHGGPGLVHDQQVLGGALMF